MNGDPIGFNIHGDIMYSPANVCLRNTVGVTGNGTEYIYCKRLHNYIYTVNYGIKSNPLLCGKKNLLYYKGKPVGAIYKFNRNNKDFPGISCVIVTNKHLTVSKYNIWNGAVGPCLNKLQVIPVCDRQTEDIFTIMTSGVKVKTVRLAVNDSIDNKSIYDSKKEKGIRLKHWNRCRKK